MSHLQSLHSYKSNIFFHSLQEVCLCLWSGIFQSQSSVHSFLLSISSSLLFRYASNHSSVFSCMHVRNFGFCCILSFHCISSLSLIFVLIVLLHCFASLRSSLLFCHASSMSMLLLHLVHVVHVVILAVVMSIIAWATRVIDVIHKTWWWHSPLSSPSSWVSKNLVFPSTSTTPSSNCISESSSPSPSVVALLVPTSHPPSQLLHKLTQV